MKRTLFFLPLAGFFFCLPTFAANCEVPGMQDSTCPQPIRQAAATPTCPPGQTQTSAPTWNGSSWVGLGCRANNNPTPPVNNPPPAPVVSGSAYAYMAGIKGNTAAICWNGACTEYFTLYSAIFGNGGSLNNYPDNPGSTFCWTQRSGRGYQTNCRVTSIPKAQFVAVTQALGGSLTGFNAGNTMDSNALYHMSNFFYNGSWHKWSIGLPPNWHMGF